jgi:L-cysteine desulfidase
MLMLSHLLKEVLRHDVQPALGCTEPVAVALACSVAAQAIRTSEVIRPDDQIEQVSVVVDSGVMKNGNGVVVPNSFGKKGNMIAAALGAVCQHPERGLELLHGTDANLLAMAERLLAEQRINLACDRRLSTLFIQATVRIGANVASATIEGRHTNVASVALNGALLNERKGVKDNVLQDATSPLSSLTIPELVLIANDADSDDIAYLLEGPKMNLALSEAGMSLQKVGKHLEEMRRLRIIEDGPINRTKIAVAAATDARMAGVALPAMSSGGSGNQGIIAILVPYLMGQSSGIPEQSIAKSLALSHLLNSYIKCFTGKLSAMCGCAVAAGVGAAGAIVYQQSDDCKKVEHAVNNVLANIAGILCDGAKGGCALKVASSAETAIMSANLALRGYFLGDSEGIIGRNADETIANLGRLCATADGSINQEVLSILGT